MVWKPYWACYGHEGWACKTGHFVMELYLRLVGGQTGSQLSEEARTSQNLKKKRWIGHSRICTKREEDEGGIQRGLWAGWIAVIGEHSRRKGQSVGCVCA